MDWSSLRPDAAAPTPLYLQLCSSLSRHIAEGALQPGDQLPSERRLAALLEVSRTTTLSAYRELEARGLVRSQVGRGTFVSGRPARPGAPFAWRGKVNPAVQRHLDTGIRALVGSGRGEAISFAAGVPALEPFPTETYLALSERVLSERPRDAFGLLPTEGHPYLREVIAAREGVRPEEILIVAGTQQALDLIARCLLCPQDAVVMDWPGFLGAIQTFRLAGAALTGWDIATTDLNELEDLFLKRRPKLLYLNPTFQNPTGRTLPLEVRQGVVALARTYRVPVVEDDVYRDLSFGRAPPPTLLGLEGGSLVLHLRTFSKTFAPGLRLGYVVADESVIDQLALVKAQSDLHCPGLSQLILAELLQSGGFDSYTQLLRRTHRARAEAMTAALDRHARHFLSWRPPEGGLYLWAGLEQGDSRSLLGAAARRGVQFAPGDSFFPDISGKRALRLCYSSTPPERIHEGVRRLAEAWLELTGASP